jgi:hypothetical protein
MFLAGIRFLWPQMLRLEAQNRVEAQNWVEAQKRVATHIMLRDALSMHNVREDVNSQPQAVNEGTTGGDALKYYELLRTAKKPLHPGNKHSKLSATVHMYNLKCVGGISNKIFSDILEFMNQLLSPSVETLPSNT